MPLAPTASSTPPDRSLSLVARTVRGTAPGTQAAYHPSSFAYVSTIGVDRSMPARVRSTSPQRSDTNAPGRGASVTASRTLPSITASESDGAYRPHTVRMIDAADGTAIDVRTVVARRRSRRCTALCRPMLSTATCWNPSR